MADQAWTAIAESEAAAMVQLIEAPARRVYVLVMVHEAGGVTSLCAQSADADGADAMAFLCGIDSDRKYLRGKAAGR